MGPESHALNRTDAFTAECIPISAKLAIRLAHPASCSADS